MRTAAQKGQHIPCTSKKRTLALLALALRPLHDAPNYLYGFDDMLGDGARLRVTNHTMHAAAAHTKGQLGCCAAPFATIVQVVC